MKLDAENLNVQKTLTRYLRRRGMSMSRVFLSAPQSGAPRARVLTRAWMLALCALASVLSLWEILS